MDKIINRVKNSPLISIDIKEYYQEGKRQKINLSSFLEQYIFYPQTIGEKRFDSISITFRGLVGNFKFIYLALLPLFYINVKKLPK